jgi:hypothetical protein
MSGLYMAVHDPTNHAWHWQSAGHWQIELTPTMCAVTHPAHFRLHAATCPPPGLKYLPVLIKKLSPPAELVPLPGAPTVTLYSLPGVTLM